MEFPNEFLEKLADVNSVAEVIALAKVYDIELTEEEVLAQLEKRQNCEIDDDSLLEVTGGLVQLINPSSSRLSNTLFKW